MRKLLLPVLAFICIGCSKNNEQNVLPSNEVVPMDVRSNGKEFTTIKAEEIANCKLPGSEATLKSLRHVSRGRVYYMDYQVDFPWENFTQTDQSKRFAVNDVTSFNNAVNETFFYKPKSGPVLPSKHGCSGFVCKNGKGQLLFCRNLDGIPGTMIVSYNKTPRPGEYKSVMLTNLSYANVWNGSYDYELDSCLFDDNLPKDVLLRQNISIMDGMNEHGLCYAIFQLPNNQDGNQPEYETDATPRPVSIDQHTGKKQIHFFNIPHLILSKCKTVDEAVEVFRNSDFTCLMPNEVVHWYLSDANNDWRIIEYWNRYDKEKREWKDTLYVLDDKSRESCIQMVPYEYNSIENYYCNVEACTTYTKDTWQYSFSNKVRVHSLMSHYSPVMSERQALECLQTGNFGIELLDQLTNWSCVYNPQERTILFNMYDDMSEIYSIDLKKDLK